MGHTHGTEWTIEKIKVGILEVVKNYELDRMPSRSEVQKYFNDTRLGNAISKRMGWYELAGEMNLKIKESDTYFGKRHEQIVMEKLICLGYEIERMVQNFPYDLLVNNAIKVDVKASRLYRGNQGNFYSFNIEKPFATCDILILVTLDDTSEIQNYYVVPSVFVCKNKQISIGEKTSKYSKFIDCWNYLEQYDNFLNNEVV